MISAPVKLLMAVIAVATAAISPYASARDVQLTLPARSKLSPVQRLNREGVEAVKKHEYQKAEDLFYKAYLYDPTDPFTLNNLGFIAEQHGQIDRARSLYALATQQSCNAAIDLSSAKTLEKKPMRAALEGIEDLPMRVNRMNVAAMQLLSQNRSDEAIELLRQARALDPRNPFTLNNLGVAAEALGDDLDALRDYSLAAASHSAEPVIVTLDRSWSGKPISAMAEESARRLQERMRGEPRSEVQAAALNLRGVRAANENDWSTARQDFLRAYSLSPNDAFSLNNRGYVAEREGDLESAQFFYEKARRSDDANATVGVATTRSAEGKALSSVSADGDRKVDSALAIYSRQRQSETGPIELIPRGNGSDNEQAKPHSPNPSPSTPKP